MSRLRLSPFCFTRSERSAFRFSPWKKPNSLRRRVAQIEIGKCIQGTRNQISLEFSQCTVEPERSRNEWKDLLRSHFRSVVILESSLCFLPNSTTAYFILNRVITCSQTAHMYTNTYNLCTFTVTYEHSELCTHNVTFMLEILRKKTGVRQF